LNFIYQRLYNYKTTLHLYRNLSKHHEQDHKFDACPDNPCCVALLARSFITLDTQLRSFIWDVRSDSAVVVDASGMVESSLGV
jgi:hypothetical protein